MRQSGLLIYFGQYKLSVLLLWLLLLFFCCVLFCNAVRVYTLPSHFLMCDLLCFVYLLLLCRCFNRSLVFCLCRSNVVFFSCVPFRSSIRPTFCVDDDDDDFAWTLLISFIHSLTSVDVSSFQSHGFDVCLRKIFSTVSPMSLRATFGSPPDWFSIFCLPLSPVFSRDSYIILAGLAMWILYQTFKVATRQCVRVCVYGVSNTQNSKTLHELATHINLIYTTRNCNNINSNSHRNATTHHNRKKYTTHTNT